MAWATLAGLVDRIDYLAGIGVSTLWLMPFYPTPDQDDGYDVSDFYGVDPRLGTLGEFVEVVRTARDRGMRVIVDLVVNHTSDQHPWFRAARSDPASPYRDWYVWVDDRPTDPDLTETFPGDQGGVWTYDRKARQYYLQPAPDRAIRCASRPPTRRFGPPPRRLEVSPRTIRQDLDWLRVTC